MNEAKNIRGVAVVVSVFARRRSHFNWLEYRAKRTRRVKCKSRVQGREAMLLRAIVNVEDSTETIWQHTEKTQTCSKQQPCSGSEVRFDSEIARL